MLGLEGTSLSDRILELESELQYPKFSLCGSCRCYDSKFYNCFVCEKFGCKRCLKECRDCRNYYCIEHETSTSQGVANRYHYDTCEICHKGSCRLNQCYFCEKCVDKYCLDCANLCPRSPMKCRRCHVEECAVCFQVRYFLSLDDSLKNQIYTLLLVFERVKIKLVIPPRYVREKIFRDLVVVSKYHVGEQKSLMYSMCLIV